MIEARKFKQLWDDGVIPHEQFFCYTRRCGISDSTVRNWTSGVKRPSAGNRHNIVTILKGMKINVGNGTYLFD